MRDLRHKILNFENWISSGLKGDCPDNIPIELMKLIKESGDTYSMYRNYLYQTLYICDNGNELIKEFDEFMSCSDNLSEHEDIINFYSDDKNVEVFQDKRFNVFEISLEKPKNGISQNACFIYQSYYEIETILIIFASVGILNTSNQLDLKLHNLRDKKGKLRKGNCIDFIKPKLRNYPLLQKTFDNAYNIQLRNTIGHNDYRITENTIQSLDKKIKVTQDDFFQSLYNIQNLNNLLVNYFSTKIIDTDLLLDSGVISIGCGISDNNAILIVHQLECFFELDNKKDWLENVEFTIDSYNVRTNVNAKSTLVGKYDNRFQEWLKTVKSEKLLSVLIQSVRPRMNESVEFITLDFGEFEVLNNEIEKEVNYKINYVPQHFRN